VIDCATVGDVLLEASKTFGDRPALNADGETWSYNELSRDARSVASSLTKLGIGPGTRVAVWAQNSRDWIVAYYGAAMAGAVIVAVDAMSTAEEVIYILQDSAATVLMTGTDDAKALATVRAATELEQVILNGDAKPAEGTLQLADLITEGDSEFEPDAVDPDTLSTIGYTSGSTGKPKGAMMSHRAVMTSSRLTGEAHGRTADDVFISSLPCTHVYGNVVLQSSFMAGGRMNLMRRFDTDQFLETIERERVTILEGVPTMFFNLLAHPGVSDIDSSSLTRMTVGGQSIPVDTLLAAEKAFGCPMLELWGMTELAGLATTHRFDEERVPGSIGKILAPMEARIEPVDEPGGEARWDGETQGEFCVRGPLVMQGYLNNPDATTETIDADGWLHTGDLATISPAGHVFLAGRKKEIILTAGYTIFPPEIEAVLAMHPAVMMVAVGKIPDETRGELAVAYVVRNPGAQVLAGELEVFARQHLAAYKAPRQIVFIDEVPKTGSGKIKRHELANMPVSADSVDIYSPSGGPETGSPASPQSAGFGYITTEVVAVQNDDRASGKVGLITMAGPKGINALNENFITEIVTALHGFDQDPEIRAMVLTGITTDFFSVGADVNEMADRDFADAYDRDFFSTGWAKIAECRKPLIAAVGGMALGGGCEIALMCDIIVAADNAEFGLPEVRLGIFPGAGGTQRLARQIGKSKAMEMILTGQINLTADEALTAGLASRVVAPDALLDEALNLAGMIAANSNMSVRMAKEAVNRVYESGLSEGLLYERRLFYSSLATADKAEGTRAFIDKRQPRFTDR